MHSLPSWYCGNHCHSTLCWEMSLLNPSAIRFLHKREQPSAVKCTLSGSNVPTSGVPFVDRKLASLSMYTALYFMHSSLITSLKNETVRQVLIISSRPGSRKDTRGEYYFGPCHSTSFIHQNVIFMAKLFSTSGGIIRSNDKSRGDRSLSFSETLSVLVF